ncbi:MAG: hypothetical protein ACI8UX_000137 [Psychromonas sp.]|jgi:hypothetical protein
MGVENEKIGEDGNSNYQNDANLPNSFVHRV